MEVFNRLTLNDFILLIPMAFAGAVFLGAIPVASQWTGNLLRVVGAIIGALLALFVVEGILVLI